MKPPAPSHWLEANQQHLMARLNSVRRALELRLDRDRNPPPLSSSAQSLPPESTPPDPDAEPPAAPAKTGSPPEPLFALDVGCAAFGLSPFERDLLLLCAGPSLDSKFGGLIAALQGDSRSTSPTFSLALGTLPGAHWSALSPAGPLRRWHLLEVGSGEILTNAPLRIDERVLHFLTGVNGLDDRLQALVQPIGPADDLPASQTDLARRIARVLTRGRPDRVLPIIQLGGSDPAGRRTVAAAACTALGFCLHALRASDVPVAAPERDSLARLWEREAVLGRAALLLELDEMEETELARGVAPFLDSIRGLVLVSKRDPWRARHRPVLRFEVTKPTLAEQKQLWEQTLGSASECLDGQLERIVTQFSLSADDIRATSAAVLQGDPPAESGALPARLWELCREHTRPRLDDLAQRLPPVANWDDLILPEEQLRVLREIAAQVRQRFRVYDVWGFSAKCNRGLGISALFAGPSGTGKTMAAEVLARELELDLYRIDLSQVVNKYIGETEKNLRRVFDAAEDSGVILLFDEADALFGKRSEVRDSHDRYANIEVSYLLQRTEAYRGLAILTTNLKTALDTAFLRRIRFVVQFPFPDAALRAEIWRRIFPANTPTEGLDPRKLSCLNIPGGNIRNIALNAAFLAADDGQSVRMSHILRAARTEYAKLEKPLTEAETKGWM